MNLDKVIKFLDNKGWKTEKANKRFVFYKPPEELGFDASYTLPVPVLIDAKDFKKSLNYTIRVLSDIYELKVEEMFLGVGNYMEILKKDAVYFKLNSKEVFFSHTLEIDHIWQFLQNLTKSHANYIEFDFRKKFSKLFINKETSLKNTISKIKKTSRLRLVDLEYKSFSFGVSTDTVMGNEKIDIKEVINWRKEVMPQYKKEVIDIDFNSPEDVDFVLRKFSDDERRAIYGPLLECTNKDAYTISITNSKFEPQKKLRKVPRSTLNKVIVPRLRVKEEGNIEVMEVIMEVDKSKDKTTIKNKDLGINLFAQPKEEFNYKIDKIPYKEGRTVKLKKAIEVLVKKDKESRGYLVSFPPLEISLTVNKFNDIKSAFLAKLIDLIDHNFKLKDVDVNQLSEYDKKIKDFLSLII